MSEENLTDEEVEALAQMGLGYGYPKAEEKQNIFAFFRKVISMSDTTRTSNLNEDELGLAKIPVRTNLELSEYCKVMGLKGLSTYFNQEAQIITNSSLSREGFLDRLAVTQKREMETKLKRPKSVNKGWFKKKQPEEQM